MSARADTADGPAESADTAEVATRLDRTTLTGAFDWLEQDVRRGERLMRSMRRHAAAEERRSRSGDARPPLRSPTVARLQKVRQEADRLRQVLLGLPRSVRADALPHPLRQMMPHGAYLAELPYVPEPRTAVLRFEPGRRGGLLAATGGTRRWRWAAAIAVGLAAGVALGIYLAAR